MIVYNKENKVDFSEFAIDTENECLIYYDCPQVSTGLTSSGERVICTLTNEMEDEKYEIYLYSKCTEDLYDKLIEGRIDYLSFLKDPEVVNAIVELSFDKSRKECHVVEFHQIPVDCLPLEDAYINKASELIWKVLDAVKTMSKFVHPKSFKKYRKSYNLFRNFLLYNQENNHFLDLYGDMLLAVAEDGDITFDYGYHDNEKGLTSITFSIDTVYVVYSDSNNSNVNLQLPLNHRTKDVINLFIDSETYRVFLV